MNNPIRLAALAAALPLLVAFAPAPDNCGGCEDISTPISSNGPLLGAPLAGGGHEYVISAVSAVTRTDGICAMRALDPPWSHVSICQEAFPCTPRVTITVEVEMANQSMHAYLSVEDGTVCTATVNYSGTSGVSGTLLVAPLFDQRVRNHCGNLDCPIEITAEIEIAHFELGGYVPLWVDEETLLILGSLACTPCGVVPIPHQVGTGD